jgi:threonine/homoserine/homoserine lactone efflux protein
MMLGPYLLYCSAALAIAIVPGPTLTVIIANSLRYGVRAGLLNVFGTVAAGLVWVAVAALGLTAAINVLGIWFDVLRYAGAIYLVWLGIKLFRSKGRILSAEHVVRGKGSLFGQAFIVTMSNPKVLLLYSAIIPPFLSKDGNATFETLLLGTTFVVIACCTDTIYALLAGKAGSLLSRSRIRAIEIISGMCLTAGGARMALRGN